MRLVVDSIKRLQVTPDAEKLIERAGRTCYKSEDRITDDSAEKFVKMLLKRGHESVIEHATATYHIATDRGISHEIVRHRIASYSQESTRYCNYGGDDLMFVIPMPLRNYLLPGIYDFSSVFKYEHPPAKIWLNAALNDEYDYKRLLLEGWQPQDARSVLGNHLKTEIVVTYNFREWRHFLKQRMSKAAHPQIRIIARMIHADLMIVAPSVFSDIEIPE